MSDNADRGNDGCVLIERVGTTLRKISRSISCLSLPRVAKASLTSIKLNKDIDQPFKNKDGVVLYLGACRAYATLEDKFGDHNQLLPAELMAVSLDNEREVKC